MQMESLTLGLYQTNCYILWEGREALILDPGYDAGRIMAQLERLDVSLRAIVLTHAHFDHVGAVKELLAACACPVYLHPADKTLPQKITLGPLPETKALCEGETVEAGEISLEVLHTPGHTPGSCCLKTGNWLFTGDTLFRDTCGRVDLPGGDFKQMYASLKKLAQLPGDFFVYPGHGEATSLERERKRNPYMKEAVAR